MKLCPICFEEYQDFAAECAECGEKLIQEEEMAKRPGTWQAQNNDDTTTFVIAGTADDLFEADALSTALDQKGIPVLTRMRRSSAMDALTEAVQRTWWEILVPLDKKEEALQAIGIQKEILKSMEADSEQAVEEEAAGGFSESN